jgi:MFS family permease
LGFFAYLLSISPALEYLGEELQMSNTLFGLHLSALALGMSLAGSLVEMVAARIGRSRTFWLGGAGMCLGTLCLIFGNNPYVTIFGTFSMGLLGAHLLIMIQALLADEFGEKRTIALTESNVVAVAFTATMPLMVYLGVEFLGGWRFALWLGIAMWFASFLIGRNLPFPVERQKSQADSNGGSLPRIFWLYCLVAAFGVAIEWAVSAWTIEFFESHLGFSKENATLILSIFFTAMIVGRVIGSRLSHHHSAQKLLFASQLFTLASFPLLWLGNFPAFNIVGIILVGLGIANFYPLCLSVLSEIGQAQPNKASAKASQSAGIAMLTVPFTLGLVTDYTSIFVAYGISMVFLVLLPIIVGISMKKA